MGESPSDKYRLVARFGDVGQLLKTMGGPRWKRI